LFVWLNVGVAFWPLFLFFILASFFLGGGRFAREQAAVQGRALAEVGTALAGAREEHLTLHKDLLRLKAQVGSGDFTLCKTYVSC
jgi:hypothetical protein